MGGEKTLDISWGTILKIGTAILLFYFLYLIGDILILVVFALIISILFNPAIDFIQKRKIPRVLATIIVYVFIFGIAGFLVYFIAFPFSSEFQNFIQLSPQYFQKIAPPLSGLGIEAFGSFEKFTQSFQGWLVTASANIFGALSAIFGGIFSALTIFSLAIFFSFGEREIEKAIVIFSPKKYETYILSIWKSCQHKVSAWFGTRILGCIFIGVSSYLALRIFKIDYSLALSLLAGATNIIPLIGPIIAGVLIVIFAALDSWLKALLILIVFVLIQQIEGNILTPILTRRFIGLPPVLVLISLLIGAKLFGILGAILGIPLAGVLYEFLREFLIKKREGVAEG